MSWLLASTLLAAFAADHVAVRTEEQPGAVLIVFEWPAPVTCSSSVEGRELYLQCDRALGLDRPLELEKQLPAWIEAATSGYDTVLIRSVKDSSYSVRATDRQVTVEMKASAAAPAAPVDDRQASLRLDLLRAQALATEGRWTSADRILALALERDPGSPEATELRTRLREDHAGKTRVDVEIKQVRQAQTERIARVSASALVGGYTSLGGSADENDVSLDQRHYRRERAELYVQHDFSSGAAVRASLFGTRVRLGGGIRLTSADGSGTTEVQVDYRRPFWEFVESIVGNGVRDRAEIRRQQRLGSRLSAFAAAAVNRYGLDGQEAARSAAFAGGLSLAVLRGDSGVAAEYGIDAESRRLSGTAALPLASREVHTGSVSVHQRFSARLSADAFYGYAIDRLGGRGTFSGARATYGGPSRLGLQIWFDRRLNSVATDQIVNHAGVYVSWRLE